MQINSKLHDISLLRTWFVKLIFRYDFQYFCPKPSSASSLHRLKGSIENQLIKVKFSIFPPLGDIGAVNIENLSDISD